jgi:cAMP receptor-like G-protein coupled receptor
MGCAASQTAGVFSDQDYEKIKAADTVASVLSFLGSGMIIICYICFADLRKFAFKLVFYLSICDIMASISGFIQPIDSNGDLNCGLCLAQAWILSIFELGSVLWTACICHCLYQAVIHRESDVQRFERWYHMFSWGIPLVLAAFPQILGLYGERHLVDTYVSCSPCPYSDDRHELGPIYLDSYNRSFIFTAVSRDST